MQSGICSAGIQSLHFFSLLLYSEALLRVLVPTSTDKELLIAGNDHLAPLEDLSAFYTDSDYTNTQRKCQGNQTTSRRRLRIFLSTPTLGTM